MAVSRNLIFFVGGLCIGYLVGYAISSSDPAHPAPSPLPTASRSTPSPCAHSPGRFNCVKYIRAYDSDTITVTIPGVHPIAGEKIPIRVNGVDSPEMRGKAPCEKALATEARDYVRGLLERARRIDLDQISRGKYFRIVANVIVDGQDLTQLLLKKGYAIAYDGGTKAKVDWCSLARH